MKNPLLMAAACALYAVSANAQSESPRRADPRVESVVHSLTLEEKIDYIGGIGFAIRAVPRLHLPQLEMSDGPLGVRSNSRFPSTVYAAGIGLAATWNPKLAERVGEGIGRDARARVSAPGGNVPRPAKELKGFVRVNLNPGETQRISIPLDTRSFEYFDADQKQWRAPAGTYSVHVGDSSAGIRVRGEVRIEEALTEQP